MTVGGKKTWITMSRIGPREFGTLHKHQLCLGFNGWHQGFFCSLGMNFDFVTFLNRFASHHFYMGGGQGIESRGIFG